MAADGKMQMPMRVMGNTGLQVSVLSFGFWATFGVKDDLMDQQGVEKAKEILRVARAAGINLYDNAETYGNPQGAAEMVMGQAIEELRVEAPEMWKREDLIITTKLFWGGSGENQKGLSRKHVMEGMQASLERLRCNYVDMVFCHRPDPFTPTETVVRAMTDLVRQGKAFYWGTSEWSAQQITEAFWIAKQLGLEPPAYEQPQYNMFCRDRFEKEYFPLYRAPYNMGTTTWSPLASGLLTGKYLTEIPSGSRADTKGYEFIKNKVQKWQEDGTMEKVKKLDAYAKTLNANVGQLAIAWAVRNENNTTTILGATKVEQIRENLGALALAQRMTAADDTTIEKILNNKPDDYGGYGGAGMRPLSRPDMGPDGGRIKNYMLPKL